jgi:hypothetical protein
MSLGRRYDVRGAYFSILNATLEEIDTKLQISGYTLTETRKAELEDWNDTEPIIIWDLEFTVVH